MRWAFVQVLHSMSPQVRHSAVAATSSQTQQLCPLFRTRSASTTIFMPRSVGKPSAISSKLFFPRTSASTIWPRHRGHLASFCDFSQDRRQWRHMRWPQGSSLGSVNGSWQTLHSFSLGSVGTEAVAIAWDLEAWKEKWRSSGAVWKSRWPSWASPSLISLMVSVDVKQHWDKSRFGRAEELCKSRDPRP